MRMSVNTPRNVGVVSQSHDMFRIVITINKSDSCQIELSRNVSAKIVLAALAVDLNSSEFHRGTIVSTSFTLFGLRVFHIIFSQFVLSDFNQQSLSKLTNMYFLRIRQHGDDRFKTGLHVIWLTNYTLPGLIIT